MSDRQWPLGHDRRVVIDGARSFGKPIDDETGVPTYSLWGPVRAGDPVERVAAWFDVPVQAVLDAVEYEELPKPTRVAFEEEGLASARFYGAFDEG